MKFSLALIFLLFQQCPWYDPNVPIYILPTTQYEIVAEQISSDLKNKLGFAIWKGDAFKPKDCSIVLSDTAYLEIACHEYKHCVVGMWHD